MMCGNTVNKSAKGEGMYTEYLEHFKEQITENGHLVGVAVGSGMTTKYAIMGGSDMIMALSSGKYRSMGLSSMAGFMSYANSNDLVMEFACKELLKQAGEIPVFFGYNATDPTKRMYEYIQEIKSLGFAGINNYPTVGMIDGKFREALEEAGLSYRQEVEAIRFAHYCRMLTVAFVFTPEQARDMADAGADIICAHFGLTYGGYLGPKKALTLEKARQTAEEIFESANSVNPNVVKMIYGGPIKTPADAQYMYQGSGCEGFIGGSIFERIPVEKAILEATQSFKENSPVVPNSELENIMFSNPGHYNYVDFIKEYINESYMTDIKLSELAKMAHLSTSYLSTLFKRDIGCSFQEYLIKIRIGKARELIHDGIPLVMVAQLVGYKDYAQFSKMYKKHTGFSPRIDSQNTKQTQDPKKGTNTRH